MTLRYLWAILQMNLKEVVSFRASSLLQIIFMLLNNLVFFVFWIVLYSNVDNIRGLRIQDVAFIFSVAAGSFGIAAGLFAGCMTLSESVTEGRLDIFLTQPKHPQIQLLASRSYLSAWGDMLSGFVFMGFYWGADLWAWFVYAAASVTGALIFLSSISIIQSLIFWIPKTERLTEQATEFMITFMLYPNTIFSPPVRALSYTIIPAAFVSYLPMLAVTQHLPEFLMYSTAAALAYCYLSMKVFAAGIRRYESGNQFVQVR